MSKKEFWEWMKEANATAEEIREAKESEKVLEDNEKEGIFGLLSYEIIQKTIEEGRY